MKRFLSLICVMVLFSGCGERFKVGQVVIETEGFRAGIITDIIGDKIWAQGFTFSREKEELRPLTCEEITDFMWGSKRRFPPPKTELQKVQDELKILQGLIKNGCEKEEDAGFGFMTLRDAVSVTETDELIVDDDGLIWTYTN